MNEKERESWYEDHSRKFGIPVEHLRKAYEKELAGENPMDSPLEIPDRMDIAYKYSYGKQSRFFRELRENKRIYGSRCPGCAKVYCPPRAHCPHCYQETAWVPLEGTGHIVAYTVQYQTTSAFIKKVPFICAYIKLDGSDFLMMANMEVDDVSRIRVGTKVKAVFRDIRHGTITDFYFRAME